ncbi:MAG: hypothetical protein NTX64_14775 [Elusimicrobia bacterium]|nr:hypothetical protein [Elusimicrobiota bacterium]
MGVAAASPLRRRPASSSACPKMRSQYSNATRPSAVRATPRRERVKSCRPTEVSSCLSCWLNVDWLSKSCPVAAEMLPALAMIQK